MARKKPVCNVYFDYLKIALIIFNNLLWVVRYIAYHLLFKKKNNGTFNHLHKMYLKYSLQSTFSLMGLNSYTMTHWDLKGSAGLSRGRKGDQDHWLVTTRTKVNDLNIDMHFKLLCIHFNDFKVGKNTIYLKGEW